MSGSGGYQGEQGNDMRRRIGDEDIERLIKGGTPGDPSLDALGEMLGDLGGADPIAPETAAAHIAAAASMAREVPAMDTPTEPSVPWYRRVAARGAQLGLTAKILLGTAVAVAATGGAAATGILPDPVQGAIADSASHVGIELPNPRLDTTTTTTTTSTTTTTAVATEATTTTTEPDSDSAEKSGDDAVVTEGLVAGTYAWVSISCSGVPVSVEYTLTGDGTLVVGTIVGDVDGFDTHDDRIQVRFEDGLETEIRVDDDGIAENEDRACDGDVGGDEGTTTTTTEPNDEPDDDEPDDDEPDDD